MSDTPFLTVAELAARWRTTENGIYCRRYQGDAPPATRVGRKLLFAERDVLAFEADHREPAS